ncbi:MAG TPA: response regulator transcription factor [Granulicella sp.]
MNKTRLLLLDDHVLFREGLVRLLATEGEFELVAQCNTCEEALAVLDRQAVDLVLLDFDLGNETGTRFLTEAHAAGHRHSVLLVTAGVSPVDSALLWEKGISGIFLKHGSPATLLEAIRAAASGQRWLEATMETGVSEQVHPDERLQGAKLLTARELQVLRCVFEGLINKQIAARIGVSESSVKATLQQLFDKTGVRTRSQLVRFALERSLGAENDKRPSSSS